MKKDTEVTKEQESNEVDEDHVDIDEAGDEDNTSDVDSEQGSTTGVERNEIRPCPPTNIVPDVEEDRGRSVNTTPL